MQNLFQPYSTYTPYARGATATLTGGQVLSITHNNTSGKKGFIAYSTVDLYCEISNGSADGAGLTNPNVGSLRIPTGQYWIIPFTPGSWLRISPVIATGSYSLVFVA